MDVLFFDSKTVPVQIRKMLYTFLFEDVNALTIRSKIELFFINLTFFIIFSQNRGLLETVMFGSFI